MNIVHLRPVPPPSSAESQKCPADHRFIQKAAFRGSLQGLIKSKDSEPSGSKSIYVAANLEGRKGLCNKAPDRSSLGAVRITARRQINRSTNYLACKINTCSKSIL
ncbi:hypothetical protein ILYODFUR_023499 [Ilyodon furcidens]|uniref:Uncharacterized protein n=1 Tax=Ilyodon furcidens TaxID=33524 RepID=A0ABV0V8Y9_9TELE